MYNDFCDDFEDGLLGFQCRRTPVVAVTDKQSHKSLDLQAASIFNA